MGRRGDESFRGTLDLTSSLVPRPIHIALGGLHNYLKVDTVYKCCTQFCPVFPECNGTNEIEGICM